MKLTSKIVTVLFVSAIVAFAKPLPLVKAYMGYCTYQIYVKEESRFGRLRSNRVVQSASIRIKDNDMSRCPRTFFPSSKPKSAKNVKMKVCNLYQGYNQNFKNVNYCNEKLDVHYTMEIRYDNVDYPEFMYIEQTW